MQIDGTWAESHRSLLGRLAGGSGLAFVALGSVSMGGRFFDTLSDAEIVRWVRSAPGEIAVEGLSIGIGAVLVAFLVLHQLWSTRSRGPLAVVAALSMAAFVAVDWAAAGVYFGLAEAGTHAGADTGIVALFWLTKMATFTDGFTVGVGILAVSVLALRARSLPAPVAGIGIAVGVYHLVELPLQLALTHTVDGVTGPVSAGTGLLWIVAVSLTLLVRPVARKAVAAVPVA